MARTIKILLDGVEYAATLTKVEREKLYGAVEIEAVDEHGDSCSLQLLASDGKTFIGIGGTANAVLSEDGDWVERSELIALDAGNEQIEPVPSSFTVNNILEDASVEEYLSHLVKSVYLLEPAGEFSADESPPVLFPPTDRIYKFPFSYRGGLEYDAAFILTNNEGTFMIIGTRADLEFVRLPQIAVLDTDIEEQEISGDELDFDLL